MKKVLIILFIHMGIGANAQTQLDTCNCIKGDGRPIVRPLDKYFIGGESAYRQLVRDSLSLKSNYIFNDDDYVVLDLSINKNGYLTNVKALGSIPTCSECDVEAVRLLKTVKKWIPACNNIKKKCKAISLVVLVPFGKSAWKFMD